MKKNLIPNISLATHEMPGCKPTLIDNILVNSSQNLLLSGVFKSAISHHHPVFNIFEINNKTTENSEVKYPKYMIFVNHTPKIY